MTKELTQEEINALLEEIEIDDGKIDYATRALAISASKSGRSPVSDETRAKLSSTLKGRGPRSDETRAKISAANTGNRFIRGPMTDEHRAKISAAKRKK